jgi:hypothetical protein
MKKKIVFASLFLYELVHIFCILTTRPEFAIEILPVSWYASVPLLLLPIIFLYFLATKEKEEKSPFQKLYVLVKILSLISLAGYIQADLPYAQTYGALNDFYSLRHLLYLVIFFIFDGIISVVFSLWKV